MCPKAKSDRHITHRIELQQTERDAFEMVAASMAVKNIGEGVGSILKPILGASLAGIGAWLAIMAYIESRISNSLTEEGKVGWLAVKGGYDPINPNLISHQPYHPSWDDLPEFQDLVPTEKAKIGLLGLFTSLRISLNNFQNQNSDNFDPNVS